MTLFQKKTFRDAGIIFFVTIASAIILKTYFIGAVCVPTFSMEPTLLPGDYVFINKMIHGRKLASFPFFRFPAIKNIERGDVLLFELPQINPVVTETPSYFLKRCIGLPGDTITVIANEVFVNNKKINFPSWLSKSVSMDFGPIVVPRNGFIDDVPAKYYLITEDYLFVIGDNVQHSYDSRYWGFLNQENVVGKAMMIYWSVSPQRYDQDISENFNSIRWDRIGSFIR